MRLVHGDVTALRESEVGSGYRLVVDTGTFHGLDEAQREAMAGEVSAVCADDATVMLDCFAPRRRGPLPRGASRADVERAFRGWEITDVEIADTEPDALARLLKFDERFYRLRETAARARASGRSVAIASAAIPSPRPTKPIRSPVVNFTFTALGSSAGRLGQARRASRRGTGRASAARRRPLRRR